MRGLTEVKCPGKRDATVECGHSRTFRTEFEKTRTLIYSSNAVECSDSQMLLTTCEKNINRRVWISANKM